MAIPTRPLGQIIWAQNTVSNSPNGNANKQPYLTRMELEGWRYGEHPPYEYLNQWQYNIYQNIEWAAVALQSLQDDVDVLGGGKYVDTINVVSGNAIVTKATHGITDPIVQLTDITGAVVFADVVVDTVNDDVRIQGTEDGTYKIIIK